MASVVVARVVDLSNFGYELVKRAFLVGDEAHSVRNASSEATLWANDWIGEDLHAMEVLGTPRDDDFSPVIELEIIELN